LKRALSSRYALNPLTLFLISIPSQLVIPLLDASGNETRFPTILGVAFATWLVAISFLMLFRPIYTKGLAKWWLTPSLALVAGAIKGALTWLLLEHLAFPQPSLFTRVSISAASWCLVFCGTAIVLDSLLSINFENRQLRQNIERSEHAFATKEQQLDWLVQARISGLGQEIADGFVTLADSLNALGRGPDSYQDIAQELRRLSASYVRVESAKLWADRAEPRVKKVLAELVRQPASLPIASVFFGLVGALVSLLFTHDFRELLISATSTAIFVAGLWATASRPMLQFLVAPFVAISPLLWHLLAGESVARIVPAVLATAIWAFTVTIVAVSWPAALAIAAEEHDSLEIRSRNSETQLDWLARKLDQTNMAIAKYIHATLQTRLMAHAMKLEQTRTTEQDMDDLRSLLSAPLAGFGLKETSVGAGIQTLVSSWGQVVDITLVIDEAVAKTAYSVEETVQVAREAIVNSVRHGLADEITLEISDGEHERIIRVSDNGVGPRTGNPGLGSKIFESICLAHELSRLPSGGSVFQATLSLL